MEGKVLNEFGTQIEWANRIKCRICNEMEFSLINESNECEGKIEREKTKTKMNFTRISFHQYFLSRRWIAISNI